MASSGFRIIVSLRYLDIGTEHCVRESNSNLADYFNVFYIHARQYIGCLSTNINEARHPVILLVSFSCT